MELRNKRFDETAVLNGARPAVFMEYEEPHSRMLACFVCPQGNRKQQKVAYFLLTNI